MLNKTDIHNQSTMAWNTWRKKWLGNCAINKTLPKISVHSLVNECKSDIVVQCAFGYSLTYGIETLKRHRNKVKIIACDKSFGYLMDRGIVPDYVLIADASVSTDWIKGHDTSRTTLVANVACNPEWTTSWKGRRVFYVNWDNIGTADILGRAADCYEVIPASSNVSNAQVVFASQVLNPKVQLLIGYDYSWRDMDYYPEFNSDGHDQKPFYMRHVDMPSPFGYMAKTSSNLLFSRNWMMQYLMKFRQTKIINCSEMGLLDLELHMPLEQAIDKYAKGATRCQ